MTVADVIADGLARAGASRVFVARRAGGDVLVDAMERRGLTGISVPRASDACVMAGVSGAYSEAPGAVVPDDLAEALDGLRYALSNRLPLVVITSGGSTRCGSGLEAVTKATLTVGAGSAAHWIAHACQLAMKEPWGPVHLDVPDAVVAAPALPVATSCRPSPLPAPDPAALDTAVRVLETAERPLVVAGRLCRSEADAAWIRAFAEARPAPVLVTRQGRGVLPDPHPLVIGTLGGGAAERTILELADLVVAIAVDPTEGPPDGWPAGAAVLELTPLASEAGTGERPHVTVVGDIGLILEELAPRLRDRRFAEWDVARLHALKQAAAAPPAEARQLAAYRVVEAARRLTPPGTVAVFDGGELCSAAGRAWQAVAPGECLISTAPFAVVTAAATQLARPQRRVVCFTETGVIADSRERLECVVALGVPVSIVAFGDAATPAVSPPPGLRVFPAHSVSMVDSVFEAARASGGPSVVTVNLGS